MATTAATAATSYGPPARSPRLLSRPGALPTLHELRPRDSTGRSTVDFAARARELGIHLFPNSSWPFIICLGVLFLGLAAIPFSTTTRIALAVIGGVIFLWGVVGWVLIEDVRMYPGDSAEPGVEAHN